jgi:hypothetical protein
VAAVESVGYGATPAVEGHHHHEEMGPLRRRLVVAAVLTVPVALLAMVPSLRFLRLGVGGARSGDACRLLQRARVPSRRAPERPPRRCDHGHSDLARNPCRVSLVGGRSPLRARCRHLLRGRHGGDHPDPARPLPGGAREGSRLGGDQEARRARRR